MPWTSWPAATRRGTSCFPIAPVAPATKTLIINSSVEADLQPTRQDGGPGCDTSEQLASGDPAPGLGLRPALLDQRYRGSGEVTAATRCPPARASLAARPSWSAARPDCGWCGQRNPRPRRRPCLEWSLRFVAVTVSITKTGPEPLKVIVP